MPVSSSPARQLAALATGCWLACSAAAFAAPVSSNPAEPSSDTAPARWLRAIGESARQTDYDGVVMMMAPGRTSTVQIRHRHLGGESIDAVESLDGTLRQVFRQGNEIRVLWPDSRTALIRPREAHAGFPQQWAQADERLLDFYEVVLLGRQRWAGQKALVLQLKPRDAYRYGQRLWTAEQGGLVLRAETLAPQGQVLEWAAFTQVTLSPASGRVAMPEPSALQGWRWVRSDVHKTSLEQEGWRVAALPPGFRLVGCVRRGDSTESGRAALVQAVFSDGVAQASVFLEPFDARRHVRELLLLQGATQSLQRRLGPWWLTVVGDVPAVTVQRLATAFERR